MIDLKYKKLVNNAIAPFRATEKAAKFDLTPNSVGLICTKSGAYRVCYGYGLAFEFDEDYELKLYPRSSNFKFDLIFSNSVGIGDSDYRGEYKTFFNIDFSDIKVECKSKSKTNYRLKDSENENLFCEIPCLSFERLRLDIKEDGTVLLIGIHDLYEDTVLPLELFPINTRSNIQVGLEAKAMVNCYEVAELSNTKRGAGGFGSTSDNK